MSDNQVERRKRQPMKELMLYFSMIISVCGLIYSIGYNKATIDSLHSSYNEYVKRVELTEKSLIVITTDYKGTVDNIKTSLLELKSDIRDLKNKGK